MKKNKKTNQIKMTRWIHLNKEEKIPVESKEQQMKRVRMPLLSFDAPIGTLTTRISGLKRQQVSKPNTVGGLQSLGCGLQARRDSRAPRTREKCRFKGRHCDRAREAPTSFASSHSG